MVASKMFPDPLSPLADFASTYRFEFVYSNIRAFQAHLQVDKYQPDTCDQEFLPTDNRNIP